MAGVNLDITSDKISAFYADDRDGMVYISHASILVRLSGKTFLFDPVLAKPPHLGSWLFYPRMEADRRLLEVDAVFVSHQHQDHYDVDFLKLLPSETPIYIVGGRPQFEGLMAEEGIRFTVLDPDRQIELAPEVTYVGINHEYNGIDSAIAISNGNFTVYHGNDCFVSNEKLAIVTKIFPSIDVACVPFAYVHWYPFLLDGVDEAWKAGEANRLIQEYLDYGVRQVDFLKPRIAIPFGANMFYADEIDSEHNKAVLSPFDFKEYVEKRDYVLKDHILPLFAGDTIYVEGPDLEVRSAGLTRAGLTQGFTEFFEEVRRVGTGFDTASIEALSLDEIAGLEFISTRLRGVKYAGAHNVYISNVDHAELGLVRIDLHTHSVERVDAIDPETAFHHFKLTNLAYKAYFGQAFTFNEIVASSRFRLERIPNEYNIEALRVINNAL